MPIDDVVAALDAQQHRRFIKTHTPLDGLELDERVTYLVVGRDPRDAAVSMLNDQDRIHRAPRGHRMPHKDFGRLGNLDRAAAAPMARRCTAAAPRRRPTAAPGLRRTSARGHATLAGATDHGDRGHRVAGDDPAPLRDGLDEAASAERGGVSLRRLPGGCRRRDDPARRGSRHRCEQCAVGSLQSTPRWVRCGRRRPISRPELWPSHESFFRAGGAREWRDIFTEAEHERYRQRSQELVAPEVLAWAHYGRQGADPDR